MRTIQRACRMFSIRSCATPLDMPRRGTLYIYVTMYECVFFFTFIIFSLPAAGLFSCSRLRGTQGVRPNTTV